jgi:hypothetical protein
MVAKPILEYNRSDKPLPTDASTAPLRKLLNINEAGSIPILAHPEKSTADSPSVFYFPGNGQLRHHDASALRKEKPRK